MSQKNEVIAELTEALVGTKKAWDNLMGGWVPHDARDEVVDFVTYWSARGKLVARRIVGWVGVGQSKFFSCKQCYRKVNEQNASIPRPLDHRRRP